MVVVVVPVELVLCVVIGFALVAALALALVFAHALAPAPALAPVGLILHLWGDLSGSPQLLPLPPTGEERDEVVCVGFSVSQKGQGETVEESP